MNFVTILNLITHTEIGGSEWITIVKGRDVTTEGRHHSNSTSIWAKASLLPPSLYQYK